MTEKSPRHKVDALVGLSLPGDADSLVGLLDPRGSSLANAPEERLREAAIHFRSLLAHLVAGREWKRCSSVGANDYWALVRNIGCYYGFSLYRYALEAGTAKATEVLEGPKFEVREQFAEESVEKLTEIIRLMKTQNALLAHDVCSWGLFVASLTDEIGFQPGELPEKRDADLAAVSVLAGFYENVRSADDALSELSASLFSFALDYRAGALKERIERSQAAAKDSLSEVSPRELFLLSTRHEIVAEKYGLKRVERVFEQQLTLLFQSLGFTVVPAKPGERGADLLCIARAEKFSFLVDAKSTKGSYSFPKTDQRAIKDYVEEFSVELSDLPALAFVLIAGPQAAGTVPGKLKDLEAKTQLPIRFMPVRLIADLRKELPGPVLARSFRDAVLGGDPVLDAAVVHQVKVGLDELAATYSRFVDGLRAISAT
jgi:hypothetical protein